MASTLKVNTIAHSGGTNAMTIDSGGRILLPQLPVVLCNSNYFQHTRRNSPLNGQLVQICCLIK